MICHCGHKLTGGKCLNPACPGRLIVNKFSLPDGKLVEIADERIWIYGPFDYLTTDEIDVIHAEIHRNDPDPAEVEDLLDHIISAANSVSIPSESNYLNELKSRLLAALSNTTPYLSQDVNVPVEKLEQDLEQYITLGSTGCRTIAEDVEFNRLHSKFLAAFRKAGE